ncbi:unnamed protein product [Rodentolepis nana]|uniref:RGS domain-containing protein n=1 Tax=Rodentolepis nana TaxID=102285 RepID=A0A0R3T5Y5_RODNA|nr:unnamed protein product [Rodentolepis nana]
MVLVQRLTLLAANIWDGQRLKSEEEEKKKTDDGENGTQTSKVSGQLTPICKQYAILEIPNPLEFFSYCLNFQTIMAGPPITFRDYRTFIEGREAEDKNLNPKQRAYFVSQR